MHSPARSLGHAVPSARVSTPIRIGVGTLFIVDALFVGLYLLMHVSGVMIDAFSVEAERSVPTWYASMKLLLVAQAGAGASFLLPSSARMARLAMLGLACVFLLFSIDEIASLHERFGWRLTAWVADGRPRDELTLSRTGYWMVVLAPVAIAVVGALGYAYLRAGRPAAATVAKALIGFALLTGGGGGIEALQNFLPDGAVLILAIAVEEGCELFGVTFLLWAALDELWRVGGRRLDLSRP